VRKLTERMQGHMSKAKKSTCPFCKKDFVDIKGHLLKNHLSSDDIFDSNDKPDVLKFRYIDAKNVHNQLALYKTIQWFVLPSQLRNPKTQKALSEELGVTENTMTNYKQMPMFCSSRSITLWATCQISCMDSQPVLRLGMPRVPSYCFNSFSNGVRRFVLKMKRLLVNSQKNRKQNSMQ